VNALPFWNLAPGQNNIATQNGHLLLAASSANPWATNQGVLAEITFQVQPGATARYLWPITLSQTEITEDGYRNHALSTTGSGVSVRPPAPARLFANSAALNNGQFSLSLSGDAGATYAVEASTDLQHWSTIATVENNPGTAWVTDSKAGNYPHRFYRVRVGP
jgi:hypothetical protein